MKTKHLILIALAAFLLFFQGSCDKDENDCPTYELPPATQTGENTIGCLIGDVVMVPSRGGIWTPPTRRFRYNEETGEMYFEIMFYADEKHYECGYPERLLVFSANDIFSEGEIEADKFSARIEITPTFLGDFKIYRYRSTMTDISSYLKITKLDTNENIISGTFSFEAYRGMPDDYDPNDKLNITKGRFDFNYRQDGGNLDGYSN